MWHPSFGLDFLRRRVHILSSCHSFAGGGALLGCVNGEPKTSCHLVGSNAIDKPTLTLRRPEGSMHLRSREPHAPPGTDFPIQGTRKLILCHQDSHSLTKWNSGGVTPGFPFGPSFPFVRKTRKMEAPYGSGDGAGSAIAFRSTLVSTIDWHKAS